MDGTFNEDGQKLPGHEFTVHQELELDATPEEVWAAISTGPGIDSWYMGRNEVEPGLGGTVRMAFGPYCPESTITAWDPGVRLAYGTAAQADGRFMAYEFLIEGRDRASTILRTVTSGFLPGDDWEDEFEAMSSGGAMCFATLPQYLAHFRGRIAAPVTVFGPPADDWATTWTALTGELGLTTTPAAGDRATCKSGDGLATDGEVYFTNGDTLGVRTDDALYRFFRSYFNNGIVISHHVFRETLGREETEHVWESWLAQLADKS